MGCDIHTIVEIKKSGKWEYVPDLPISFDQRCYGVFSILNRNVRNSTGKDGFEGKGLPKDVSGRQFRFVSQRKELEDAYNKITTVCWIESEKRHISLFADELRTEIDFEFYEELKSGMTDEQKSRYYWPTQTSYPQKYYVQDAHKVNGEFVEKPQSSLYKNIDEFNKAYYHYVWDDVEKDYGYYEVDFDSNDFHSASYLTLSELKSKVVHLSPENSFVVPKQFIDYLRGELGELPETMDVKQKSLYEVTVSFDIDPYDTYAQDSYNAGVHMIQNIKEKYNVESDDDIRIVFAFDS